MITTWIIIAGFFGLLIAIALISRNSSKKSSGSFFRGNGNMLWWMIGASAFMQQFSAWTFTGAQGQAFSHGWQPAFIFIGNAIGFYVAGLWLAPKIRRMRIATTGGGVRMRFGKASLYSTTLLTLVSGLFSACGWMLSLGTFVAIVLGVDVWVALLISGLIVTFVSVTGGAKAVIASDFMQSVLIVVISITASVFALGYSGLDLFTSGKGLPVAAAHGWIDVVFGSGYSQAWIPFFWVFMYWVKQTESVADGAAGRWIAVKSEKDAKKAGILAGTLMIFGALIWFLPSFHMGAYFSEQTNGMDHATAGNDVLNHVFGVNAKNAKDVVFYTFSKIFLPLGFVGLITASILAATLSSADSYMSRTSGDLTRNIIEPGTRYFAGKAIDDKKMVIIGKSISAFVGLFLTGFAIWMSFGVGQPGKGTSLFDYMIKVTTLISFPLGIAKIMGQYFIRKTPDWGLWLSLFIGALISATYEWVLTKDHVNAWFSAGFTSDDWAAINTGLVIGSHILITGGVFWLSKFFYNEEKMPKSRVLELKKYWSNVDTPVKKSKASEKGSRSQRMLMAKVGAIMGGGLLLMSVIPQDAWWEHLVFFPMAGVLFGMSYLFFKAAKNTIVDDGMDDERSGQDKDIDSMSMNEYLKKYVRSHGVEVKDRRFGDISRARRARREEKNKG